jgi:hypothetical protein
MTSAFGPNPRVTNYSSVQKRMYAMQQLQKQKNSKKPATKPFNMIGREGGKRTRKRSKSHRTSLLHQQVHHKKHKHTARNKHK